MSIKDCRPKGPKSATNFTANARHTGHTNEEILLMSTLRPSAPFPLLQPTLPDGPILGL
jgi:hypothetical protein